MIANYGNNDEVAQNFHKRTGIEVIKWDVSAYEACQKNIHYITEKYGAVDVLVNNAGLAVGRGAAAAGAHARAVLAALCARPGAGRDGVDLPMGCGERARAADRNRHRVRDRPAA